MMPPKPEDTHLRLQILVCGEYLIGYEGNAFTSTGDREKDLLSTTAVHPLQADAVHEMLVQNHLGCDRVDALMQRQELAEVAYSGKNTTPERGRDVREHGPLEQKRETWKRLQAYSGKR